MSGLIAMACGETARFSEPYDSLMNLARSAGWGFKQFRSMSIAENWNAAARYFLSTDAQWIFLTNDDHVYPPDTLVQLLSHQRDAVTALYLTRQATFVPVLGAEVGPDGRVHPRYLRDGERGLVRVEACGDGALLLHRRVLEAIPEPRWELGVYQRDACDHDTAFSVKVREAGFDLWCDLDVCVGHLAVMPVFPRRDEQGKWSTGIIAGPTNVLQVPAVRSPLALVSV